MRTYNIKSKPTDEELFNNPTWVDEMMPEDWDNLITKYCPEISILRVRPKDAIDIIAEVNGTTIFKTKQEVYALLSPEHCPNLESAPMWPGDAWLDQIFSDHDYGESSLDYGLHWLEAGKTYIIHRENKVLYEVEEDYELQRIMELADYVNTANAEIDLYLDH